MMQIMINYFSVSTSLGYYETALKFLHLVIPRILKTHKLKRRQQERTNCKVAFSSTLYDVSSTIEISISHAFSKSQEHFRAVIRTALNTSSSNQGLQYFRAVIRTAILSSSNQGLQYFRAVIRTAIHSSSNQGLHLENYTVSQNTSSSNQGLHLENFYNLFSTFLEHTEEYMKPRQHVGYLTIATGYPTKVMMGSSAI